MRQSTPRRIKTSNVFVLGSGDRTRITIATQQVRAFTLCEALLSSGRVHSSTRIAVVGGGFSGMAVSAILSTASSDVTLIEANEDLLPLQRGNHSRYVHPYIYDWPDPNSLEDRTSFPLFNWMADYAGTVAERVLIEWKRYGSIKLVSPRTVEKVATAKGHVQLWLDGAAHAESFELVVFCVGFGLEPSERRAYSSSYWRDDALHQIDPAGRMNYRIIGNGDGGLTDALRLCLKDFDHKRFLGGLLSDPKMLEIGTQAAALDATIRLDPDAASKLATYYQTTKLPAEFLDRLRDATRRDTKVVMQSSAPQIWRTDTSLLNRLLVLGLCQLNLLTYQSGRFDFRKPNRHERVILRTGPRPAINRISGLRPIGVSWTEGRPLAATPIAFPRVAKARRARAQTSIRIFLLCNADYDHTAKAVYAFSDEISRSLTEQSVSTSVTTFAIEPDDASDGSRARLERALVSPPDFLVVMSSDLAAYAARFRDLPVTIILLGADQSVLPVYEQLKLSAARPPAAIAQVVSLEARCLLLNEFFPRARIGFISDGMNAVDEMYYSMLAAEIDRLRSEGRVELELVPIHASSVAEASSVRQSCDLFVGRYAAHKLGLEGLFKNLPYASGYRADISRGAVASFDTADEVSANWLAARLVFPIALGSEPFERLIKVRHDRVTINKAQCAHFGLTFSPDALSLVDESE